LLGVGVVDTFGRFNKKYDYLDWQQQLCENTGTLIIRIGTGVIIEKESENEPVLLSVLQAIASL